MINSVCVGGLHLCLLSCEERVTNNFCFVDEQVVMGNKLLVYIR